MIEIQLAQDVISKIVFEKRSFSDALSDVFSSKTLNNNQLSLIRSLSSCTLHHYRLLFHHVDRYFPMLTIEEKLYLMIAVGNNVFIKRIEADTVFSLIQQYVTARNISLLDSQTFCEASQAGSPLIDPSIAHHSPEYLELKFNTPLWLIKMWSKHFGLPTTLKILQANSKPVVQACRVNTLMTTADALVKEHAHFTLGPVPNTVIYEHNFPLKKEKAFQDHLLFSQRLAVTDVINAINFDNVHGQVLIVESRPQALYLEIPIITNNRVALNVVTNSIERKLMMQKSIQEFGLSRVNVFEANANAMLTHISQKQDMVLVVPQCSKFDIIRSLPDFFAHFHQEDLDGMIQEQTMMLDEASTFVEQGGLLFYGVNTLNQKEGAWLVKNFLTNHPDFALVYEKQFFPFDSLKTALYVAAIRKKKEVVHA
jgi:16S rRNA C967 or C1407 C5-methylase (RsmB/RsmF family)